MVYFIEYFLGQTHIATSRVRVDKRRLHKGVSIEPKAENLGLDDLCCMEVRWRSDGREKERESAEIRVNALETHAEKNGDWGIGVGDCWSSLALDMDSNEGVPNDGFESGMGKVETWMR